MIKSVGIASAAAAAIGIFSAARRTGAGVAPAFAEAAGCSVPESTDDGVPSSACENRGGPSCPSFGGDDDDPRSGYVRVYDGVLSPGALDAVQDLCVSHEKRHEDGSSYFVRRPSSRHRPGTTGTARLLTPLERVMDSILDAFNDTSPYVEYWSRDEYLNVDAHCDIDEGMLEDEDWLRGPDMGHVLYLSVGQGVLAPTIVFPDRRIGWDRTDVSDDAEGNDPSRIEMVSVPALGGRLLRFDGRAMHAVPRPADRYLMSEMHEHRMRYELNDDDDDYVPPYDIDELGGMMDGNGGGEGDNDDHHWYDWNERALDIREGQRRFVLLFNTWSGGPPRGVSLDSIEENGERTEERRDSEQSADEDDNGGTGTGVDDDLYRKWGGQFGEDLERLKCEDMEKWAEAEIVPPPPPPATAALSPPASERDEVPLRVKLMGGEERRVHPNLHATLYLSRPEGEALATAVQRKEVPSRFNLRQYLDMPED